MLRLCMYRSIVFTWLLCAQGGTMQAAVQLVELAKATVVETIVAIELLDLKGRQRISAPVFSVWQY